MGERYLYFDYPVRLNDRIKRVRNISYPKEEVFRFSVVT